MTIEYSAMSHTNKQRDKYNGLMVVNADGQVDFLFIYLFFQLWSGFKRV